MKIAVICCLTAILCTVMYCYTLLVTETIAREGIETQVGGGCD